MKICEAISIAIRVCMESALKQTNGNVTHAARLIGVHRTHFYKIAAENGVSLPKRAHSGSVVTDLANWRRA